jgi:ABC-type glycerol-3-phosphate transport system substrate-binding protein
MMRKTVKVIALALVASIAFAGAIAAQGKQDVKIKVYTRWSGDDPLATYFRQKVKEFNELKKGIVVENENIANEDSYLDKLRTGFATGTPPNVFIEYGGSRILDYVASGALVDLKPYLEKDKKWSDSYLPFFEAWTYKDHPGIYGAPQVAYAVELFYNKATFAKLGLKPPKTLDELRGVCDKLVKSGYTAFQLGEKDSWRGGHFLNNLVIKSFGPEGVQKLAARTMAYDGPEMTKLYSIIKEFNDKGYFGNNAVGVDNNAENTAFTTGKSALEFNGSWFLGDIEAANFADKVGVVPFPTIDPKYAACAQGGSADGWSVSKTKDPAQIEASVEFIKFISSPDYFKGLEKTMKGGMYPVKFTSDPTVASALTRDFVANLKGVTSFTTDIQNYDSASHMLETVRLAVQGLFIGKSPADCGKEIVEQIKAGE